MIMRSFPLLHSILEKMTPASMLQKAKDHAAMTAEWTDRRLKDGDNGRPDFVSLILRDGISGEGGKGVEEGLLNRGQMSVLGVSELSGESWAYRVDAF
jgi:hypothetical protein